MSTTFVWGTDTELSTLDVFVPTSGPALTTLHVDIGPTTRSEDELVWPPEAPSNTEPITTGPEITITSSTSDFSDSPSYSSAKTAANISLNDTSTGPGPAATSDEPNAGTSWTHRCSSVARNILVVVGVMYATLYLLAW